MKPTKPINSISDLECYLVGGAVRDKLLGVEKADIDWVVVGACAETMLSLGFIPVGKDFPVYLHPKTHQEYALARTERKSGRGYKGFEVDTSTTVKLEDDLVRRDLTINAMAMTSDEKSIIDPFGGQADLNNRVLRHVSVHFSEDPLRVLRVARFAARYFHWGFTVEKSTMELMKSMADSGELSELVPERIWQEIRRALGEDAPSEFFFVLRRCGALVHVIPEFDRLFEIDSSDTACNVMQQLERVSERTKDVTVRFCFLVKAAIRRHQVNDISNSQRNVRTAYVNLVRQLCNRLKVSAAVRRMAVNLFLYTDTVSQLENTTSGEIVDMILAVNGIRNPEQFLSFTDACKIILSTEANSNVDADTSIETLQLCRKAIKDVDAESLAQRYSGIQLTEKIRQARIIAVDQVVTANNT